MLDIIIGIITTPAIIVGLVALVGLLLQRKKFSEILKGTIKTILGLLILSAGAGVIVDNLIPFSQMFTAAFNLTGVVPFDEAVIGALIENVEVIARTTSFILALGFAVNILLARLTPFKYIFLTGHMMWIMAGALAWAFHDLGVPETQTIIFGSLLQGAILVLLPALAQPIMRKVTGNDDIAYGHLTTIGVVASAYVGKIFGDSSQSSEDLKVPESLNFFKDTAISVSLVMAIVYVITALFAGKEFTGNFAGEQNYVVFSLIRSLGFTAGVLILLQGVRMFLGEIVPAFRGIALKLVPGAKPALDVPVIFHYAPTALMLGFIFSVAGMMAGMFACRIFSNIIPLPSIIGGFFTGGVAGIFGNALGGRRGAMVSGFVYGLFLTIPVALFYPLYGLAEYGIQGVAFLVSDGIAALSLIKVFFVLSIPYVGLGLLVAGIAALSFKLRTKKQDASV